MLTQILKDQATCVALYDCSPPVMSANATDATTQIAPANVYSFYCAAENNKTLTDQGCTHMYDISAAGPYALIPLLRYIIEVNNVSPQYENTSMQAKQGNTPALILPVAVAALVFLTMAPGRWEQEDEEDVIDYSPAAEQANNIEADNAEAGNTQTDDSHTSVFAARQNRRPSFEPEKEGERDEPPVTGLGAFTT